MEMRFTGGGGGGLIYLTLVLILPSPVTPPAPPPPTLRKEIFHDSLSRNLGLFPTFYVLG